MKLVAGKKAVVLGLGISGMAAVKYLQAQGLQVAVSEFRGLEAFTDGEKQLCKGLELETGGHSKEFVLAGDYIVPSPGVPLDVPILEAAREQHKIVVGELALAAGEIPVPVIAVTGSNGKTTVTGLIGTLLENDGYHPFVGGNIGTPLLSYLLSPQGYDVVVLELSSFQLDLSGDFRPDIGLLLNLSPDHLDRHGDMEGYVKAKRRIFANQLDTDTAILGGDDPLVMEQARGLTGRVFTFGCKKKCQARIAGSTVVIPGESEKTFELSETKLNSKVNRLNAAAALLASTSLGASNAGIRKGLNAYTPPEHRMTLIAEIDGVRFVNDSKATNVGAMAAALESCSPGVILLAGGRDKDGDFTLVKGLVQEKVKQVICIGEAGPMLVEMFADIVAVEEAIDMEAAVGRAASVAESGQVVLLAPGCASFDMFSGYAERGRVFTSLVRELQRRELDDQSMLRLPVG